MDPKYQKKFAICLMVLGLTGVLTAAANIAEIHLPCWLMLLMHIPALYAIGWLMLIGFRRLMGKE